MSRAEIKKLAKQQIEGNIFTVFLMTVTSFIICFACNLIPIAGAIIALIITPALGMGFTMAYLSMARNEKITAGDLFKGFNLTGKTLWLSILIGFFTFLWSLLLWIPGIIKSLSYSAAPWILAENPHLTAGEALNRSKIVMNGHKWELFVLQLSFILWDLLVVITFGIASIYVIPYTQVTLANFYRKLGISDEDSELIETEVEVLQ